VICFNQIYDAVVELNRRVNELEEYKIKHKIEHKGLEDRVESLLDDEEYEEGKLWCCDHEKELSEVNLNAVKLEQRNNNQLESLQNQQIEIERLNETNKAYYIQIVEHCSTINLLNNNLIECRKENKKLKDENANLKHEIEISNNPNRSEIASHAYKVLNGGCK